MSKITVAIALRGQSIAASKKGPADRPKASELDALWASLKASEKAVRGGARYVVVEGAGMRTLEEHAAALRAEAALSDDALRNVVAALAEDQLADLVSEEAAAKMGAKDIRSFLLDNVGEYREELKAFFDSMDEETQGKIRAAGKKKDPPAEPIPAPAEKQADPRLKDKQTEDAHYKALEPGKRPAVVVKKAAGTDGKIYEARMVSDEDLSKPDAEFSLAQWCRSMGEARSVAKVLEESRSDKNPLPDTWPAGKSPQALDPKEVKSLPTALDKILKLRRSNVTAKRRVPASEEMVVRGSSSSQWYEQVATDNRDLGALNRGKVGRVADRLMTVFTQILDKVSAKTGERITSRTGMEANKSLISREILKRVRPGVDPRVYLILEDENYHFLNELMDNLGLYGEYAPTKTAPEPEAAAPDAAKVSAAGTFSSSAMLPESLGLPPLTVQSAGPTVYQPRFLIDKRPLADSPEDAVVISFGHYWGGGSYFISTLLGKDGYGSATGGLDLYGGDPSPDSKIPAEEMDKVRAYLSEHWTAIYEGLKDRGGVRSSLLLLAYDEEDVKALAHQDVTVQLDEEESAKLARSLGYKIDADSFDDVSHGGYSADDAKGMSLPKQYDGAEVIFPDLVAMAAEDADRDAIAAKVVEESKDAVVEALKKVDLGSTDYYDDGLQRSLPIEGAGVTAASWDGWKLTVTVKDPGLLYNWITSGMGYFATDIDPFEPMDEAEVKDRLLSLGYYYDIMGESKPEVDDRAVSNASPSDEDLAYHLDYRLKESGDVTPASAADAIIAHMRDEYEDIDPADADAVAGWMEEVREWAAKVAAWTGLDAAAIEADAETKLRSGAPGTAKDMADKEAEGQLRLLESRRNGSVLFLKAKGLLAPAAAEGGAPKGSPFDPPFRVKTLEPMTADEVARQMAAVSEAAQGDPGEEGEAELLRQRGAAKKRDRRSPGYEIEIKDDRMVVYLDGEVVDDGPWSKWGKTPAAAIKSRFDDMDPASTQPGYFARASAPYQARPMAKGPKFDKSTRFMPREGLYPSGDPVKARPGEDRMKTSFPKVRRVAGASDEALRSAVLKWPEGKDELESAKAWQNAVIDYMGGGYHPDDSGAGYVDMASNKPTFTEEEARAYDALLERAHAAFRKGRRDIYRHGLSHPVFKQASLLGGRLRADYETGMGYTRYKGYNPKKPVSPSNYGGEGYDYSKGLLTEDEKARLAEAERAEKAEEVRGALGKCATCGKKIGDSDEFDRVGGKLYCPGCSPEGPRKPVKCDQCGRKLDPEKGEAFLNDTGGVLCNDCFMPDEGVPKKKGAKR